MKIKYAFLTLAMAVALVGCNQPSTEPSEDTTMQTPVDPTVDTPAGEQIDPATETSDPTGQTAEDTAGITADEAKNIAFEKAGVTEADVTDLEVELDEDNGVKYYEVNFDVNNTDYDYDIDAITGEIIGEDID